MNTTPLPLYSRASEVDQVMSSIQSGESCLVIGIGSVGKSNLIRFIQQPARVMPNLVRSGINIYLFM